MEMNPASARIFASVLEQQTGQTLSDGRNWRLDVALDIIGRTHGLGNADAVAAALTTGRDPGLADAVVEALLNHETSFFRDANVFRLLFDKALPLLIAGRPNRTLRIWSAGCSTGQETYSIAMALCESPALDGWKIDIHGTDVSPTAVAQARRGVYSQFEIQRGLPIRQLLRWFDGTDDIWTVKDELRRRVRFERLNLLNPPPTARRFDIVLCRNVLFYFNPDVRRRAFDRLADAVAADGVLLLGAGETAIGQTDRFASDPVDRGLYRPVATRTA
jgi:chemotaxis protein methyltransferase CheR